MRSLLYTNNIMENNTLTVVTKQDMVDFINSQPDDKEVNFLENTYSDQCGCVMVHYAKSKGIDFDECGMQGWYNNRTETMVAAFEADVMHKDFEPDPKHRSRYTYKELKELVKG